MKIYCICECGEHTSEEATIEINFREGTMFFVCPKCKKEQNIQLKPKNQPLPRIRTKR
jgi:hypothetical protein